jgi:hypothetical protein
MSSTFVGLNGSGFWMRDGTLELWLRLLALHIEDPKKPGTIAAEIRDQWLFASRGFFIGCVPVMLERFANVPEGNSVIRKAVQSFLTVLEKEPGDLPKNLLSLIGMDGGFTTDFPTSALIEVGHAFCDLLDGKITLSVSGKGYMPGSGLH